MELLKRVIEKLIRFIFSTFIKVDDTKIIVLDDTPFSGSNSYALYDYAVNNQQYKNIELYSTSVIFKKVRSLKDFKDYLANFKKLYEAKYIIVDHGVPELSKKQVIIELWHGIPLKSLALMDKSDASSKGKNPFEKVDLFSTTSDFSANLLNACFGIDGAKYKVLGSQRNDWLFLKDTKILCDFIKDYDPERKVIVYMPTFKDGYFGREEGYKKDKNIFAFDNFDLIEFDRFLEINKLIMVVKLHPFEENYYKDKLKTANSKNIVLLESDYLKEKKLDIYKFLAVSDLLITDYSSVYLDYLLTNKPMLFNNVDIEEYKKIRGIILEPYDFWTPGPKVNSQDSLQTEIIKLFKEENYYLEQRKMLLDVFHKYQDDKSCERAWNYIDSSYIKEIS